MFCYKVEVESVDLGSGKLFSYGGRSDGFPARVIFTESVQYGVCVTETPLDTSDKVISISEVEFRELLDEINSKNKLINAGSSQMSEIEQLKLMVADLGLMVGGGI